MLFDHILIIVMLKNNIYKHSTAGKFVNLLECSIFLHKYDPKHQISAHNF